jgi:hypothetical protein
MADLVIRATKAPALALSPITFSQQHFDLYSQQLRVYFNTLDSFTANLSTTAGGSSLSIPHISALDTTDQYATADNTPTIVKWNTLDSSLGFTLNPGFYATAQFTGYYKIDYSLQFANTANAPHDVVVWLRVNNVDVAGSASKITITSRKSAGVPSYVLMYSTVPFEVEAGDEIALWWATDKAYNTTGPVDGVYMEFAPAQTVPYAHPSIPSSIGAITFVSRTQI